MRIYQLIHLNQVFTYRKNLVKENSITPSVGKKERCHNFFFLLIFLCFTPKALNDVNQRQKYSHVTFGGILSIQQSFECCPLDWQSTLARNSSSVFAFIETSPRLVLVAN